MTIKLLGTIQCLQLSILISGGVQDMAYYGNTGLCASDLLLRCSHAD